MNLPNVEARVRTALWSPLPDPVLLGPDEVHVTMAPLELPASHVLPLERLLAEDELRRAKRFYFEKDRRRYIVARASLRLLLGRYLKIEPDRIRFTYGPHGKPFLADECHRDDLRFNVAHSDEVALYAVTRSRMIGVDLERIRRDEDHPRIAKQFFSEREIATLRALPSNVQDRAFFSCWTRKEAYLKAQGSGFSQALRDFDVSLSPGEPAALLSHRTLGPDETARWSLEDLTPAPDYVAALAVEGHGWQLQRWKWRE